MVVGIIMVPVAECRSSINSTIVGDVYIYIYIYIYIYYSFVYVSIDLCIHI